MKRFFICGLPRSGTTWLANFFTHAGVHCHHEALTGCETMEEYTERMSLRDYYAVGDSDSLLARFMPRVRERFQDAIWVGIDRDVTEVALSLQRVGLLVPSDEMFETHRKCLQACDYVVNFHSLFLTETLRELWQNVTGLRFDTRRAEMLLAMRIEPDLLHYAPRYYRELPKTMKLARDIA